MRGAWVPSWFKEARSRSSSFVALTHTIRMNIHVKNLSKTYGHGDAHTKVLKDVSCEITKGEFVTIVGTSGSGKTTLLNVMGGLDRDFSGHITMGTHKLETLKERELARLRNEQFGFIFQQFHLLDHLTAIENVALPEFFSRAARAPQESLARAEHLLEQMNLSHKKDAKPTELSGGQKQRVAIARALFNNPGVLFCDEPTGSLDRATGEQIMELFRDLNRTQNLTLIVVTHEEHIAQMASRIIRLEDGVLTSDELVAHDTTPQEKEEE